jgi:TP901 family phage tail tape measure protein
MPTDVSTLTVEVDSRGVRRGTTDLNEFGRQGGRTQTATERLTRSTNIMGAAILAAGAAAALVAVKNFADFEKALVGVGKTTGATGAELEELGVHVQEISRRLPVATTELLNIAQAAGQLGVTGTANIVRFTETVGKLGLASDLAGEEAATSLARILTVTGTAISDVDRLGSTIVQLGNNFAATESEIAAMTTRVSQATAQFNITAAEAVGISTALKAVGIEAENGGTQVGKAFNQINQAVRNGGEELKVLEEITGQSGQALREAFLSGQGANVFANFVEGLGRIKESGGDVSDALYRVGLTGDRSIAVFGTIASRADTLAEALDMANKEWEENTALTNEALIAAQTFSSQVIIMKNLFIELSVKIGKKLALTSAIESASKVVKFFIEDLTRLGIVLGGITLLAIPALIAGIRSIGIAIAANPLGLILTAITLVTLAAYEFRREIGNTIVKTFEVFIPNALDHARISFINLEVGIGNLMNGMLESINDFANDLINNSPKWLQDFLGISGDSFRLGIDVNAALAQIDELQNAIAGRTRNFTNPFLMPTATSGAGGGLIDDGSLTGVQDTTGAVGSGMRGPGTGGMSEEEESKLAERVNREMEQREEENERILDDKNRKLKAEKDYYDRLFNLQAGSQQAGLDFGNAIREMDYKSALSNGALMIGNLAQSSNSMFKIQKAFALANAVVTLPSAVMKSFDNGGGYPFGLIPAGLMLAKGMQQISAIRSSSFSGGGSTPSVGSGSTSPSVPASSGLPTGSTAVPEGIEQPAAPQVRELRVSIEGDGPHSEGMRKFAVNLAETIKDMGGTTNLVIS